ncbi:MAG: hypothetical protein IJW63_01940 [Lachnospiraceae bacterium]|nr:hypothetical protein [Lachnospiraceae bacterium]
MEKEDEEIFRTIDQWFVANLPEPEACKNGEKVITFFKTETTGEMLEKIAPAMSILDKYEHPYDVVYTNFVGTIVYEDEWQVAVKVEGGKMI